MEGLKKIGGRVGKKLDGGIERNRKGLKEIGRLREAPEHLQERKNRNNAMRM